MIRVVPGSLSNAGKLEITDLLWSVDSKGERTPVGKAEVISLLEARDQRRAARIVGRMPALDGVLDSCYVDALGVRVHCELQRLSEELQLGKRVAALLAPLIARLRGAAVTAPIRIVDVGCGLGYVVRSIAAADALGPDVELLGVDLNAVLVDEANRLARREARVRVRCSSGR